MTTAPIVVGSAVEDSAPYRGWLVGHFVNPADGAIRRSEAVEIRWTPFPAGTERAEWVRGEVRTTIVLLVSGHFRILFSAAPHQVDLKRPGDYVMWGPGVDHKNVAIEDSVIVVVRWPSVAGQENSRP